MTVYARGYRAYAGPLGGPPAWWVVFRANAASLARTRSMRVMDTLLLVLACAVGVLLYVQVGLGERIFARGMRGDDPARLLQDHRLALLTALRVYYTAASVVIVLLSILTGAGLVADDLRARTLSLVMVRPVRPLDYALGKALVMPWFILTRAALPGLAMWLLVGAWQAPGQTQAFWAVASDVPGVVASFSLLAAGAYTGLVLLISSGTPRRAVASGLAAAVLFGGLVVRGIGLHVSGLQGEAFRLASLSTNALAPVLEAHWRAREGFSRQEWLLARVPDTGAAAWLAVGLLLLGFVRTWWRARSVEVSE
ncbi:MAG: ABC transporter permease [Planctomycetia bacterium]